MDEDLKEIIKPVCWTAGITLVICIIVGLLCAYGEMTSFNRLSTHKKATLKDAIFVDLRVFAD